MYISFGDIRNLYGHVGNKVFFCLCPTFPFGIEVSMWEVMVFIPDHCLTIYFVYCVRIYFTIQESSIAFTLICSFKQLKIEYR